MIELALGLFSSLGSAGFGSALKLFSGFIQGRHEQKMARLAMDARRDSAFQSTFQDASQGGMSNASAWTRRILAIIILSSVSICGIYCVFNSNQPFQTLQIPASKSGLSIFWGLITFPSAAKDVTVTLTTGHLALMFFNIGAMTAGFYFTPSGRK